MSKTKLERALVRASQSLAAGSRPVGFETIKNRLSAAVTELNAAHDELARGGESVLAQTIDTGLREIDAVLSVVCRRCE